MSLRTSSPFVPIFVSRLFVPSLFVLMTLAAAMALAQAGSTSPQAPAEVDHALRARVNEFMQDQVDGKYFEALDLVAAESKKIYFSAQRIKILSFKIDAIEYTGDFAKATVTLHVKQSFSMMGKTFDSDTPRHDTWMIENGQWVMFQPARSNKIQTPIGEIEIDPNAAANPSGATVPKELTEGKEKEFAKALPVETSVNKKSVQFTSGKAATEEIVFHNGVHGYVTLQVDVLGDASSIVVDPREFQVAGDTDQKIQVKYTPARSSTANPSIATPSTANPSTATPATATPATATSGVPTRLRLTVIPFELVYVIPVRISR